MITTSVTVTNVTKISTKPGDTLVITIPKNNMSIGKWKTYAKNTFDHFKNWYPLM